MSIGSPHAAIFADNDKNQKLPWHHKVMTMKNLNQIHVVSSAKIQNDLLTGFAEIIGFPKESKEDRSEAEARIFEALQQVHKSVHSNHEGKKDTLTLYVGNLERNASEQNLREALDPIFETIHVEKITTPRVKVYCCMASSIYLWPTMHR